LTFHRFANKSALNMHGMDTTPTLIGVPEVLCFL